MAKSKKKNGQIWIETVLYTLIGLALIGLVLAIATPKINKAKDRIAVEQAIESLNILDGKINEVLDSGPGNVRSISAFTMKRGELYINPMSSRISFSINDLSAPYSEPGVEIEIGKIILVSEEKGSDALANLTLDYKGLINLTYSGEKEPVKFTASSVPYSFVIENLGGANITNINVKEVSGSG
jgi:type II secretory pathway pseudopilin PulG